MSEIARTREQIATYAKSMFDRGLTHGSTGNISARLSDGSLLVTPTGSSMGFLDPARISHLSEKGALNSGDKPTKEIPLHAAFYETRHRTGAVVHLHSCHSVALSLLPEIDPDNVLPPLTAYGIMLLGKVRLLPFFVPGDPAMGDAVRGLAGNGPPCSWQITDRLSLGRTCRRPFTRWKNWKRLLNSRCCCAAQMLPR